MNLQGKHILLGVTGGIAAYKTPMLVRALTSMGASVQVVMTPDASRFVTAETLSVVSRNPVHTEWFNNEGSWNNHVTEAEKADLLVIAPATANTLSAMACGRCDNLLLGMWLSARCPVLVAPAMDHEMTHHQTTRDNLSRLSSMGVHILGPEKGELASGIKGDGRMTEPEKIATWIEDYFKTAGELTGKTILITSGPTYEPIDQVRFIGNNSSGKMGHALAMEAIKRGAKVKFITGPVARLPEGRGIEIFKVNTAREMFEAASGNFASADIAIFAAAVADFAPTPVAGKIKKENNDRLALELHATTDILKTLAAQKKAGQLVVGFALEANSGKEEATRKLKKKNLDLIVLNSMADDGATFGSDLNKVTVIDSSNNHTVSPLLPKPAIAGLIFDVISGREILQS